MFGKGSVGKDETPAPLLFFGWKLGLFCLATLEVALVTGNGGAGIDRLATTHPAPSGKLGVEVFQSGRGWRLAATRGFPPDGLDATIGTMWIDQPKPRPAGVVVADVDRMTELGRHCLFECLARTDEALCV